jgi:predicted metal-dependent TIM-barrel fold hydrolase
MKIVKFIDSHVHLTNCSYQDLESMYLTGIREVVSPINWSSQESVYSETMKDIWDHQIDYELKRTKGQLVKSYAMIGISMVSVPKDWEKLMKLLPEYLKKPEVVAIGEIGFQPGSRTCNDLEVQEEIVKQQIKIAIEMNVPVVFHIPEVKEGKDTYTQKTLDLCKEGNLPMSRVLLDHTSALNIDIALNSGAFVGISVQPWRNLNAKDAAKLILEHGSEQICLNSDISTRASDAIAVARTAYELKQLGASDNTIEKVCYLNAKNFYGI